MIENITDTENFEHDALGRLHKAVEDLLYLKFSPEKIARETKNIVNHLETLTRIKE